VIFYNKRVGLSNGYVFGYIYTVNGSGNDLCLLLLDNAML